MQLSKSCCSRLLIFALSVTWLYFCSPSLPLPHFLTRQIRPGLSKVGSEGLVSYIYTLQSARPLWSANVPIISCSSPQITVDISHFLKYKFLSLTLPGVFVAKINYLILIWPRHKATVTVPVTLRKLYTFIPECILL